MGLGLVSWRGVLGCDCQVGPVNLTIQSVYGLWVTPHITLQEERRIARPSYLQRYMNFILSPLELINHH